MNSLLLSASNHHITRKCAALIFGYSLWFSINQELLDTCTVTVPLHFYNSETLTIQAPESATVAISGKRKHLNQLHTMSPFACIDASLLPLQKTSLLTIKADHINLPKMVNMVSYIPLLISVYKQ